MSAAEVLTVAEAHYRRRVAWSRGTVDALAALWRRVDGGAVAGSWLALVPAAAAIVTAGQLQAARSADDYLDEILDVQGIDPTAEGRVAASRLAGVASDGRVLAELMVQPAFASLRSLAQGSSPAEALGAGELSLRMIGGTQVADAGRVADGVALTARKRVGGYVRMLNPPSCSRCVVLAGRWYRWNKGFRRHPLCNCLHVSVQEDTDDDVRTEPKAYFHSLTAAEQDKVFTKSGAEAIRLGGDPSQVVNARRGMQTATIGGRQVQVTTEGTTRRGTFGGYEIDPDTGRLRKRAKGEKPPPRLMPEQVFEIAGEDRDEAIRLLRRNGYLTT